MFAGLPEVENIHLIAHSRGTDVAVSALRELVIAERAAGRDPKNELKIANFVMLAPDLDLQVVEQRIAAERLGLAIGRLTIYTSPSDKAIGLAESFFASPRGRLGTLDMSELSPESVRLLKSNPGSLTIVSFIGESDRFGHSYFRTNPAVSSDLLLMLRYGLEPGDPGRPLEPLGLNFWRIPPDYPNTSDPPPSVQPSG